MLDLFTARVTPAPEQYDFSIKYADDPVILFQSIRSAMNRLDAAINNGMLSKLGAEYFIARILNCFDLTKPVSDPLFALSINPIEGNSLKFNRILSFVNALSDAYGDHSKTDDNHQQLVTGPGYSYGIKKVLNLLKPLSVPNNNKRSHNTPSHLEKKRRVVKQADLTSHSSTQSSSSTSASSTSILPSSSIATPVKLEEKEKHSSGFKFPQKLKEESRQYINALFEEKGDVEAVKIRLAKLAREVNLDLESKKNIVKTIFIYVEKLVNHDKPSSYMGIYLPLFLELPDWKKELFQPDAKMQNVTIFAKLFSFIKKDNEEVLKSSPKVKEAVNATLIELAKRNLITAATNLPVTSRDTILQLSMVESFIEKLPLASTTPVASSIVPLQGTVPIAPGSSSQAAVAGTFSAPQVLVSSVPIETLTTSTELTKIISS